MVRSFCLSDFKPVIDHPPKGCTIHSVAGLASNLWPEDGAEEVRHPPAMVGAWVAGHCLIMMEAMQTRGSGEFEMGGK